MFHTVTTWWRFYLNIFCIKLHNAAFICGLQLVLFVCPLAVSIYFGDVYVFFDLLDDGELFAARRSLVQIPVWALSE